MVELVLILMFILILPFIILGGLWLLEVTADILYFVVKVLDRITGYDRRK